MEGITYFPPTYILWVLSESKTSFLVRRVLYKTAEP